jgi:hypothetical protein
MNGLYKIYDKLHIKNVISILMESSLYFTVPVEERLQLVKEFADRYTEMD